MNTAQVSLLGEKFFVLCFFSSDIQQLVTDEGEGVRTAQYCHCRVSLMRAGTVPVFLPTVLDHCIIPSTWQALKEYLFNDEMHKVLENLQ